MKLDRWVRTEGTVGELSTARTQAGIKDLERIRFLAHYSGHVRARTEARVNPE